MRSARVILLTNNQKVRIVRRKFRLSKRESVLSALCAVFFLANVGAIGNGGRRRAKEMVCASNLRRWAAVLFAYVEDHHGYFMDRGDATHWPEALGPYYGNRRLLLCPEARRTYAEGALNPYLAWEYEDWRDDNVYRGSYVINLWLAYYSDGDRYWGTPYASCASSVPMMLDGQWKDMEPYPEDQPPVNEGDMWTPNAEEMRRACLNRHNGVNAVFMDGSVRKVGLKHLWVQWWYRGWEEDLAQVGFPDWPEWMSNFPDP